MNLDETQKMLKHLLLRNEVERVYTSKLYPDEAALD
jgi:hypothetical protein